MSSGNGEFSRETETKYTNLAVIASTEKSFSVSVSIPDSVPCNDNYRIRVISSKPADTSMLSTGFRVVNMPLAKATVSPAGAVCAGETFTLEAQAAYKWTYSWLLNGQPVPGEYTSLLKTQQQGTYSVVVSNGPGCTVTSDALPLTVNTPVVPELVQRGDSLIAGPAAAYQWYRNGQLLDGATQATLRAPGSARYSVHTTDANGCKAVSAELSVLVTAVGSVELEGAEVKLFPNPASGKTYLQFAAAPVVPAFVTMSNAYGVAVYRSRITSTRHELQLTGLPAGIYFVQASTQKAKATLKLFVQ